MSYRHRFESIDYYVCLSPITFSYLREIVVCLTVNCTLGDDI